MKKIIPILLLMVVLISSLTACGQSPAATTPNTTPSAVSIIDLSAQGYYDMFNGKSWAVIYHSESAELVEQTIDNYFKKKYNLDFHANLIYVDSLTDGLLMLRSGKIASLQVLRFTGRYLAQRNNDLAVYGNEITSFSTRIIFSLDKGPQLEKVNTAIKAMQEDGTMDKLVDQWITNLPVSQEPSGAAMPVLQGAETIKVGISGDAPPLDYIAADGAPGGFNVAVLSEIGRRTNLNIELVTVNGGARFAALQSGKINAFLWHNTTQSLATTSSGQEIGPPSFLQSEAYLTSRGAQVTLKK
jgi:ABC-type amino acid transport substrate-binding protein